MVISELNAKLRTQNLNKQIILSFILKILSMALGFLVIPKTLSILGDNQYGIWLTILSVVTWLVTFDVGIGNGLRNKLTEALSVDDIITSQKLISTAYIALGCIGLFIIVLTVCIYPFLNWNVVFNTKLITNSELGLTMFVITIAIIVNFVISIINQVMNAFQLAAYTNILSVLQSFLFLSFLYILNYNHDLFTVTKVYSSCLIFSGLFVSFFFFNNKREYIPRLKFFEIKKVKEILKLGGGFFIIQIATVFMFSITSMLIIQLLKPADVTTYNVAFRLFSILTLVFSLIVTPYWSAFTEANRKGDFTWIKNAIFKLHIVLGIFILGALLLILFHQSILDLWLGKNKVVPGWSVAITMGIYAIILNWSNIYSHYLNGIGKLRLQTIIAVVQAIAIIPLCLLFTNYFSFGLFGIMLSMALCMLPFAIVGPIITYKTLKN